MRVFFALVFVPFFACAAEPGGEIAPALREAPLADETTLFECAEVDALFADAGARARLEALYGGGSIPSFGPDGGAPSGYEVAAFDLDGTIVPLLRPIADEDLGRTSAPLVSGTPAASSDVVTAEPARFYIYCSCGGIGYCGSDWNGRRWSCDDSLCTGDCYQRILRRNETL